MKLLTALSAVVLLAITTPPSVDSVILRTAACDVLNAAETDLVLQDVRHGYAPDTAFRAIHGVPDFQTDSAQIYDVAAACDSAEASYRAWRVAQGDPNVVIPVTLIRLGGTKMFLGTALIGRHRSGREYVVYDSLFSVKHVFSYQ